MNFDRVTEGGLLVARAEGDPPVGTALTGLPTGPQLAAINNRIARRPLTAEQVYVVAAEMTNTLIDAYMTWMDDTSLARYVSDVGKGKGVPAMTHHMTYGNFAVGRWFEGFIEQLPTTTPARARRDIPYARDALGRKTTPDQRLVESAFLVRDRASNGMPNTELIDGIEDGTIDSVSIGGTLNPVRAPMADLICDICNASMLYRRGEGCNHFPGAVYEVVDVGPVMATARYMHIAQREGSFVTLPGNYSALVQRALVDRAVDLAGAGQMDPADARRLEEVYGASILPARTYSIPGQAPAPAADPPAIHESETTDPAPPRAGTHERGNPVTDNTVPEAAPAAIDVRRLLGEDLAAHLEAHRADGRGEWEVAARLLHGQLHRASGELLEADRRRKDLGKMIAERLGQSEGEDLAACLDRVDREREAGRQAREQMLGDLVRAYTTAHNLQEAGFDKDRYLRKAAAWSLEDIADEIETLGRLKSAQFTSGTTVPRTVEDPDREAEAPKTTDPKPVRPAYNPAFSRS